MHLKAYQTITILTLTGALSGMPLIALAADSGSSKAAVLVDRSGGLPADAFRFMASVQRSSYKPGEPIQFEVQGTKDFHLYIFNIGSDGRTVQMVPNARMTNNQFKAGMRYVLPDAFSPAITGHDPGRERFMVVASTKPIQLNSSFAGKGDFMESSTPAPVGAFMSKDISWLHRESFPAQVAPAPQPAQPSPPPAPPEMETYMLEVEIEQPAPVSSPTVADNAVAGIDANGVTTMLSTVKTDYRVGEAITLTYASTQAGIMHFAYARPNGDLDLFRKERVKANSVYNLRVEADRPGNEKIVAWVVTGPTLESLTGARTRLPASGVATLNLRIMP